VILFFDQQRFRRSQLCENGVVLSLVIVTLQYGIGHVTTERLSSMMALVGLAAHRGFGRMWFQVVRDALDLSKPNIRTIP